jgi:hypothetical protein
MLLQLDHGSETKIEQKGLAYMEEVFCIPAPAEVCSKSVPLLSESEIYEPFVDHFSAWVCLSEKETKKRLLSDPL